MDSIPETGNLRWNFFIRSDLDSELDITKKMTLSNSNCEIIQAGLSISIFNPIYDRCGRPCRCGRRYPRRHHGSLNIASVCCFFIPQRNSAED